MRKAYVCSVVLNLATALAFPRVETVRRRDLTCSCRADRAWGLGPRADPNFGFPATPPCSASVCAVAAAAPRDAVHCQDEAAPPSLASVMVASRALRLTGSAMAPLLQAVGQGGWPWPSFRPLLCRYDASSGTTESPLAFQPALHQVLPSLLRTCRTDAVFTSFCSGRRQNGLHSQARDR